MKERLANGLLISISFFVFACSSTPKLTQRDRLTRQTRIIQNVSYTVLFSSLVKAVREENLDIKISRSQEGFILATFSNTSENKIIKDSLGNRYYGAKGEVIEFLINLEPIKTREIKVRLSLQKIQSYNLLGSHEGLEIIEEKIYQAFFKRLKEELAIKSPGVIFRLPLFPKEKLAS